MEPNLKVFVIQFTLLHYYIYFNLIVIHDHVVALLECYLFQSYEILLFAIIPLIEIFIPNQSRIFEHQKILK